MIKTIAVVGNSQLAFFIACHLDKALGDNTHIRLLWFTNTKKINTILGRKDTAYYNFEHLKIMQASIKGINLRDSRITTNRANYEYELLCVDQTPVYTSSEREKILDQFETLISSVRSKENRGIATKAKVSFLGKDAESVQLALDLAGRCLKDSSSAVSSMRVELPSTGNDKLDLFVKESGVSLRRSPHPGIEVSPPITMFASDKIKGLRVDNSGRALTLASGEVPNHPNAIFIDNDDRLFQNIARSDWQLAKQISDNIEAKIDGGLEKPIDFNGRKQLHSSGINYFACLGSMVSKGARARAIASLERQFWSRLFKDR